MTPADIVRVSEELGWDVQWGSNGDGEEYVEFYQGSPAGEDFGFTIWYGDVSDVPDLVGNYYWNEYDADEHVESLIEAKRNGLSGVPRVSVLVKDAEAIDRMLQTLWIALNRLDREER